MTRKSTRRFLKNNTPEFSNEAGQGDAWEALYIRSLMQSDHYVECEAIFSRPVRDYGDRNTEGKGLSH